MCDIIVDLNLGSPEEDALLSSVLDAFISQQITGDRSPDEGPEMMVRTVFATNGVISKKVIFQSPKWADAFVSYWESQKMQMSAA